MTNMFKTGETVFYYGKNQKHYGKPCRFEYYKAGYCFIRPEDSEFIILANAEDLQKQVLEFDFGEIG